MTIPQVMEPGAEGGKESLESSISTLQDSFGSAAVLLKQSFDRLNAFSAFGTATTGCIHIRGAPRLICRDGFLQFAIG